MLGRQGHQVCLWLSAFQRSTRKVLGSDATTKEFVELLSDVHHPMRVVEHAGFSQHPRSAPFYENVVDGNSTLRHIGTTSLHAKDLTKITYHTDGWSQSHSLPQVTADDQQPPPPPAPFGDTGILTMSPAESETEHKQHTTHK